MGVSGHLQGATALPAGRQPTDSLLGGTTVSLDIMVAYSQIPALL